MSLGPEPEEDPDPSVDDAELPASSKSLALAFLHAPRLWFKERHDVLGNVYQVALVVRLLIGLHAVVLDLFFVLPVAGRPWVVVVAVAIIVSWGTFISLRLLRPSKRTMVAFVADALVTLAVVVLTPLALAPEAPMSSLAGFWICGAALYAAIFASPWVGTASAALAAVGLFVVPSQIDLPRVSVAFAIVVLAAALGMLIAQFRRTIVEQEQERIKVAALAERERLSRIVHDGALQVLALVEREGPALGPMGMRLATLARESEAQLRVHLQDREVGELSREALVDITGALDKYNSARVTVSVMAGEVLAPRFIVDEVEATLREILKNVERHAGEGAEAWILLDQEVDDEVILWVRDNGIGMTAKKARKATEQGRFGIRDSIIGRISAIGGSAILKSAPGAGTEWELRIPIEME